MSLLQLQLLETSQNFKKNIKIFLFVALVAIVTITAILYSIEINEGHVRYPVTFREKNMFSPLLEHPHLLGMLMVCF